MTVVDLELDLPMLAADIAKMLGRNDYPIDASAEDILPALGRFVAEIVANARDNEGAWEETGDAATWTAAKAREGASNPVTMTGPAPDMTYYPWRKMQSGVELGATGRNEHYWRCPVCGAWNGPYGDGLAPQGPGSDHRYYEHDRARILRSEVFRIARKASSERLLAARFDAMVGELAAEYALDTTTTHRLLGRVAGAIERYERVRDAVSDLTRGGFAADELAARTMLADIAGRLGRDRWLNQPER